MNRRAVWAPSAGGTEGRPAQSSSLEAARPAWAPVYKTDREETCLMQSGQSEHLKLHKISVFYHLVCLVSKLHLHTIIYTGSDDEGKVNDSMAEYIMIPCGFIKGVK